MNSYILEEYGDPIVIECKSVKDADDFYYEIATLSAFWKEKLGLPFNPFEQNYLSNKREISIRAKGVTGFLKIGNKYLEIAPKFLFNKADDRWRTSLTRVLILTNQYDMFDERYTLAKGSTNYLADLMAERFYRSLEDALGKGLPRYYNEEEASLNYFKGRLDIRRVLDTLTSPNMVPCIFEDYSQDFVINRLLRWAAIDLSNKVISPKLSTQLIELSSQIPDAVPQLPNKSQIDSIVLPPQFSYLDEALYIARLLADSTYLTHGAGDAKLKGFLWNSHVVFESLVKLIIRRVCKNTPGWNFTDESLVLARGMNGVHNIITSPDVRIVDSSVTKYVLDAKYKIWSDTPKTSDVYQVLAGARVANCNLCGLIYPKTNLAQDGIEWIVEGDGSPDRVIAIFIDINEMANSNGLNILSDRLKSILVDYGQRIAYNSSQPYHYVTKNK